MRDREFVVAYAGGSIEDRKRGLSIGGCFSCDVVWCGVVRSGEMVLMVIMRGNDVVGVGWLWMDGCLRVCVVYVCRLLG